MHTVFIRYFQLCHTVFWHFTYGITVFERWQHCNAQKTPSLQLVLFFALWDKCPPCWMGNVSDNVRVVLARLQWFSFSHWWQCYFPCLRRGSNPECRHERRITAQAGTVRFCTVIVTFDADTGQTSTWSIIVRFLICVHKLCIMHIYMYIYLYKYKCLYKYIYLYII